METKNYYKFFSAVLAASFLLFIGGCHKDNAATGSLYLHVHTDIDTTEVDDLDSLYPDQNGRLMSLSFAQFFMSSISIHNSSTGNWYTIPNTYVLKRIAQEEYYVGNVPAGNYDDIRFDVGVDAATDSLPYTSHSPTGSDSALATQDINVYSGWTVGGYYYMNLQGRVDLSPSKDGSQLVPFSYQIGNGATNSNLRTATLPVQAFSIVPGQSQVIHMIADYGKLLHAIDMTVATNRATNSQTLNPATATLVADSIPAMFRYEYDY